MATHTELMSASTTGLLEVAVDVVARAMRAGATAAEAVARDGTEFSTTVRMGQVETLKEAGGRGVGLRVFRGKRAATTYSSDFSQDSIDHLVKGALELAAVTSEDPTAGLPDPAELGAVPGDLQLFYDDVYSLPAQERIEYARRGERAALDYDPRIKNSDGASFDAGTGQKALANSLGFTGEYRGSRCSISVVPIAQEDGKMQRDYWYSTARSLRKLEQPEEIGRIAAQRTLRRLGARKIASTKVPIVLDRTVAASFLDSIFDAASGDAIYRQSSFLCGKLGEQVAGPNVTIIDDGIMPGGFGTRPFDGEGVPTRRTAVVENGVLKSYLLNTYTARKLGLKTTGNASRGLAGNPGIGSGNFFLQPGQRTPQQIIGDIKQGVPRLRRKLGDGGLLTRRQRAMDRKRRTYLSGGRSHRCGQSQRHAEWDRGNRQRSGIPRIHSLPDSAN
jgi:PmbA protein